tara:strand:+ start:495 stop:1040 length:546 start_codon:yes stop_codon:yes gene_type:complete
MEIEKLKFIESAKILLEKDPYISFWDLLAEYEIIPPIRQPRPSLEHIEACGYRHDGMGNIIGKSGKILRGSRDGSMRRLESGSKRYGKDYQIYNIYLPGYGSNGRWSIQGHTLIFAFVHRRWPRDGYVIDHIDDDPFNNHPDNLREVTHYENHHHIKKAEKNTIVPNKINGTQTNLNQFFN